MTTRQQEALARARSALAELHESLDDEFAADNTPPLDWSNVKDYIETVTTAAKDGRIISVSGKRQSKLVNRDGFKVARLTGRRLLIFEFTDGGPDA